MGCTDTPIRCPGHTRSLTAALTIWVAGLLAVASGGRVLAAGPLPVPTVEVRAFDAVGRNDIDGVVQAVQQATVAAQLGGTVLALQVRAGDAVARGQPLARLDDREAAAGVQGGDATLARAQAELAAAQLQAQRTRELRAQGFVSAAALDLTDSQLKVAQAGVAQAQAARSQASLARSFAQINAPFEGIVLATHVEAGDLATPGRPIVTLYAPGALRVVVQLPSAYAAAARQARSIEIELPGGAWVKPAGTALLPGTDPVSQTIEWRLELPPSTASAPSATPAARPGQAARVRFVGPADGTAPAAAMSAGGAPPVMGVPASALVQRSELQAVYVVQGDGFVLRAVRVGRPQGAVVPVLAGLRAGERVAVNGVQAGLTGARPADVR